MICKNPYCKSTNFCAVIEPDTHNIIGVKCLSCGARYLAQEIEIKEKLEFDRKEGWNSVFWGLLFHN